MELNEIYQNQDFQANGSAVKVSFEVFPPKDGNISKLFDELRILKKYNPQLVSLTYGANGGTRDFSLELLRTILDLELNVMPHFTCMCSSKEIIEHYITQIENMGIENILALRGDKIDGDELCTVDFRYANELVDFIHQKTTLSIGVAGYPEGHIEAESLDMDIDNLKRKVDAGASAIFTQMFFDNNKFFEYVQRIRDAEIYLPVIPGILPVRSLNQMDKMISMARISVPKSLRTQLEQFPDDVKKIGTEFAINQCGELIDSGVCGIHFFTLNHSDQVCQVLDNI